MRVEGTLKFFNSSKGFGFISPADGSKDVFVHASALEASGIAALDEGDKVTFVVEDDPRGRGKQASQIEPRTGKSTLAPRTCRVSRSAPVQPRIIDNVSV